MNKSGRVRAVYLATIVAVVAMAGGFTLATVLSSTTVNQSANFYQGGNGGANGYSAPALKVSTTPGSVAACTSATTVDSTTAQTVNIELSNTTGAATCATGHFAEEFTLSFSATISRQFNNITLTSQVGAGTIMTNTAEIELGTGSSGAFTATINLYVDYGAVNPPASGVTVLDFVVQ